MFVIILILIAIIITNAGLTLGLVISYLQYDIHYLN